MNETKHGYKKTKLGWMPEGWEIRKLGSLINHTKGFAFKSSDFKKERGHRVIKVSDTDFKGINEHDPTYMNEEKAKEYQKYALKNGDIVFSTVGSRPPVFDSLVGKAIQITNKHEGALLNQNNVLVRVKDKNKVVQNFLYPHFRTNRYIYFITTIIRGNANQGSITLKDLFNFRIPLPPIPEQKKIAEILSTWDLAIETLEQLIAKKEELKKGLMQQLLTGKKRFPGFEGEWTERKLGDLINTFSGGTPSRSKLEYYGGSIPWIKSGELNTRRIYTTEEKISAEGLENSSAKLVNKNTLLLAIYGATAGVISVNMMEKASINQAVLALIPKNDKVDQGFLELWFSFNKDRIVHTFTQGGQPNLSAKIVKGLKIECPTIEEQRKISKLLFSISDEIESIKQSMQVIKIQKKGLMQQLLTGKTRVEVEQES